MSTPWFLERLGLDESADERAIKRAYALRLKKIDQAADIDGFSELHRTYQAALAWHASRAPQMISPTVGIEARTESSPGALVDHETSPERHTGSAQESNDNIVGPEEVARLAHARLVEQISHGSSADPALREQLDVLRLGHLRAPFLFELRLIESLADGSISQRFELFNAAQKYFSWKDIGHLQALGRHGGWVNSVKKESHAWSEQSQQLPGVLLLDALMLGSTSGLPSANQWPKIQSIIQRYPHFLSLQLDQDRVNALQRAFEALPDNEKNWALDTSPLAFQQGNVQTVKPRSRSGRPIGLVLVVVIFAIRLIGAIANSMTAHESHEPATPPASTLLGLNLQRFAPTTQSCESLIPIVDRTAPFQDDERTYLKNAVRSCLRLGYWPANLSGDDAVQKLGL
ncbi:hypothetical protein [Dyella sp. GSA-30]|uniref:hypothetical protein n=1 Tax=Dyella sp. GSA-30 TaxID=2994496 RepID=UPI002492151D|nr:hypothetical protein [Dyella sp. GSA-30]BDU19849.1 hypothetical protein DYGSA30_13060 [Dyella sp. GSA-30]